MKKYLRYILLAGALFVIISMGRTILGLLDKGKALDESRERVGELKKEQEELLKTKEKVESDEFIEKEAREKLGLAKPGETVVVLPDEETLKRLAQKPQSDEFPKELSIWRKWVEMFFSF